MTGLSLSRPLPPVLEPLRDFATDLRWTWSHAADHLWRALDPIAWSVDENPWHLLQDVSRESLDRLAGDTDAVREVTRLARARREYLDTRGWFGSTQGAN